MKDRYVTLDAMRGVAALFVVYRHFSEAQGAIETQFSYLAVDLFFVLSGFVLALRYDRRGGTVLPVREFLIRRVVRLYPLFALGMLLAIARALVFVHRGDIPILDFVTAAVTGLLMLPSPTAALTPSVFPLMGPAWSLFFELFVANMLFACVKGRLSDRALAAIVAGAAATLLAAERYWGTIDLGATWPTFVGGIPRVIFSFFAGVLLQRLHQRRHDPNKRGGAPSWIVLAVLAAALLPRLPDRLAPTYELTLVFAAMPALVYFGAGAIERRPRFGLLLGDMSYAVYVIHLPLLLGFVVVQRRLGLYGWPAAAAFLIGVTVAARLLAQFYDEPVRRAINRWRRQRTT